MRNFKVPSCKSHQLSIQKGVSAASIWQERDGYRVAEVNTLPLFRSAMASPIKPVRNAESKDTIVPRFTAKAWTRSSPSGTLENSALKLYFENGRDLLDRIGCVCYSMRHVDYEMMEHISTHVEITASAVLFDVSLVQLLSRMSSKFVMLEWHGFHRVCKVHGGSQIELPDQLPDVCVSIHQWWIHLFSSQRELAYTTPRRAEVHCMKHGIST